MAVECVDSRTEVQLMTEHKLKIGKVQVILFKSSRRGLIPLALVISFTAAALGTLSWVEHRMARQTEDLRAQAAQVEYENDLLEQYTQELGSVKSVERIAREELGMVSPDTILIEAQVK